METLHAPVLTSTAELIYQDRMLYVNILKGAELTAESLNEQFEARKKLVGSETYVVLVDATKRHDASKEAREFMARNVQPARLAMAIVSGSLPTRIVANFYIRFNKPKTPTRLFGNIKDAEIWLKKFI